MLVAILFTLLILSNFASSANRACNLKALSLAQATKVLESCFTGNCETACTWELAQLRKRTELASSLNDAVEVMRLQLNESAYRERSLLTSLTNLAAKGSSPSEGTLSLHGSPPATGSGAWPPGVKLNHYRFVQDARHVKVYQFSKEGRQSVRTSKSLDNSFLGLFLQPALSMGKVHEVAFRILSTGSNVLASGTDAFAIGVSALAGENFGKRQLWSAPTSIVLRSLDGAFFDHGFPQSRWVSYIGRPLVILDVLSVRVDLTNSSAIVLTYAINGKYGVTIRRNLQFQSGLQVHLIVENFAIGAQLEIL